MSAAPGSAPECETRRATMDWWLLGTAWMAAFLVSFDYTAVNVVLPTLADTYDGDAQATFGDRLPNFDRIIADAGTYAFATGKTSIDEDRLATIVERIDGFFGFRTAQLESALRQRRHPLTPADARRPRAGV